MVAAFLSASILPAVLAAQQQPMERRAFEVASVRQNLSEDTPTANSPLGPAPAPVGRRRSYSTVLA